MQIPWAQPLKILTQSICGGAQESAFQEDLIQVVCWQHLMKELIWEKVGWAAQVTESSH